MLSPMKTILFISMLLLVAAGCSTPAPALSVTDTTAFSVKGRQGFLINQKLRFGDYETSKIKRSWTHSGNTRVDLISGRINPDYPNLVSMDFTGSEQSFHFSIKDFFGNRANVYAVSDFYSEDLQIGDNPNSVINILEDIFGNSSYSQNLFYLQVFVNNEFQPWQLVLDNQAAQFEPAEYLGHFILNRERYYTLKPINKIMSKKGPRKILMGSVGYEIFNQDGMSVAAVSLQDKGEVYLHTKDPSEKLLLSSLCAALLLQQDIADAGI